MIAPGFGLTSADMATVAELVYRRSGIRLTDAKRALVTARLQKRVRAAGFDSFGAYLASVSLEPDGAEGQTMVEALTTNKTSFFREPTHYEYLATQIVPELLGRGSTSITGWSAGCATGEEAYSLAIVLLDTTARLPSCAITIRATDLCTTALSAAAAGVYASDRVTGVPLDVLHRHFEYGVEADEGRVRVQDRVRRLVQFEHGNLLQPRRLVRPCDFIWCRNTLMYFDHRARQQAIAGFEANLAPGGYFFLSHAENLSGLDHHFEQVAPAVYRKRG